MKATFLLSVLGLISAVVAMPQPQLPGATSVPVSPASGAQVVRTYTSISMTMMYSD